MRVVGKSARHGHAFGAEVTHGRKKAESAVSEFNPKRLEMDSYHNIKTMTASPREAKVLRNLRYSQNVPLLEMRQKQPGQESRVLNQEAGPVCLPPRTNSPGRVSKAHIETSLVNYS